MRLSLLLFFFALNLEAKTIIDENYQYYSVSATKVSDLLSALNNASRIMGDDRIYHASTDTLVKWHFYMNEA